MLARKGLKVGVWARTEKEAAAIKTNGAVASGFSLEDIPANLSINEDPREVLTDSKAVIIAVPSQTMRQNIQAIRGYLNKSMILVSASKGLEIGSNLRMTQVIAAEIDHHLHRNICALSGPNLAREILSGLPAATIAASEDDESRRTIQRLLTTPNLCVLGSSRREAQSSARGLIRVKALSSGPGQAGPMFTNPAFDADAAAPLRPARPALHLVPDRAAVQRRLRRARSCAKRRCASNGDPIPRRLSLYVHVPFCMSPCFYCGCNRIITRDTVARRNLPGAPVSRDRPDRRRCSTATAR